MFSVVLRS